MSGFLSSQPWGVPLLLTLKVSLLATMTALFTGTLAGFLMSRAKIPGWRIIDAVGSLPLVLPPTVIGYYLLVLVGRRAPFGRWLESSLGITLIFDWKGAVLAATVVAFPLVYKAAKTAFEGVDPNLEQAGQTLGASNWVIFWRISLPLAWPGLLSGSMLAFARAMGEFGATLMVAGNIPGRTQTLSLAIYEAVQASRDQEATFMVILISIVAIAVLAGSTFLNAANTRQRVN